MVVTSLRPHYLRAVLVALALAGLTVQANTYGEVYTFTRTLPPGWGTRPCVTVPDLRPSSPTYGQSICVKP